MPLFIDPLAPPPTPPTSATSGDGFLTATLDPDFAGVLLEADLHTLTPTPPKWIYFYRVDPDGSVWPVRSGNLARSPGGYGTAYDHEAPLGAASTWYIVAYANPTTPGATYGGVGLTVPAPAGGMADPSTWLKSIDEPALSIRVPIVQWGDFQIDMFTEAAHVLGRELPIGAFDTAGGLSGAPIFGMYDLAGLAAVRELVGSGQLLIQPAPVYKRPQFFAVCTGVRVSDLLRLKDGFYGYQFNLTEIDRPDTTSQGLRVPGHSYADRLDAFPLYSSVPARTYGDAI